MLISPFAVDACGRRELFNARDLTKVILHLVYFYLEREKMQVRFYANMQTIAGQEVFEVTDLNGDKTLRGLLNVLIDHFPNVQPYLFNSKNDLLPDVPIFVNGRNPRLDKLGVDMPLRSDDIISMFSPISSGKMNVEVMRDPTFNERK